MSGRLSPDPEAAVSARYYGAVTTEHLDRLARLAAAERERFARRWPRYRDRFLAATLAQGAALHMLTGSTGVKDLDVVLLFAALPGERFPEFPRLVKHVDFGPSSLGRKLAKEIGVPARRINEIVHGQRRISADTALRLARFFGTSERFWINLQARYDLEAEKDRLGDALDGIRPLSAAS
ncbi:MAG TPA: HigA family addiction module antitoxin [Streptosporangiaceae bacterium]|jgi:addiction module HigA family antidote|nr:HigA family addiction module antitoxin [Streptosporangiaceae bacterium]